MCVVCVSDDICVICVIYCVATSGRGEAHSCSSSILISTTHLTFPHHEYDYRLRLQQIQKLNKGLNNYLSERRIQGAQKIISGQNLSLSLSLSLFSLSLLEVIIRVISRVIGRKHSHCLSYILMMILMMIMMILTLITLVTLISLSR